MRLHEFIEQSIKDHPDNSTLFFINENGVQSLKDGEIISKAKELAFSLKKIGLKPRERVVLLGETQLAWLISFLAILYAEGVAVPIDTELLPDDTNRLILKMDPSLVICSENQSFKLQEIKNAPFPIVILQDPHKMMKSLFALPNLDQFGPGRNVNDYDDAIAAIFNSSGTGGKLKGILLTHQNIIQVVSFYKNRFMLDNIKNVLCILPCYAIYSLAICLASFANGQPVYFADAKKMKLMDILQKNSIHSMPLVPSVITLIHSKIMESVRSKGKGNYFIFKFLMKLSRLFRRVLHINISGLMFQSVKKTLGSDLELIMTGGAPLNPAITKDLYDLGYTVKEGYGLTETGGVVTCTDGSFDNIGTCGKVIEGMNIRIHLPDGDGCGEILIEGPRLMAGYFRDPEATQNAFLDRSFCTGDLGKFDEKQNLHVLGRSKDIIVHSDERKTLPHDVEIRYTGLDGIEKLAVVGIPDDYTKSDIIHAAIIPNQQLCQQFQRDENLIKEHVRKLIDERASQLPPYLRIVHVHLFDSIPINTLGKVKREEIKEIISHL